MADQSSPAGHRASRPRAGRATGTRALRSSWPSRRWWTTCRGCATRPTWWRYAPRCGRCGASWPSRRHRPGHAAHHQVETTEFRRKQGGSHQFNALSRARLFVGYHPTARAGAACARQGQLRHPPAPLTFASAALEFELNGYRFNEPLAEGFSEQPELALEEPGARADRAEATPAARPRARPARPPAGRARDAARARPPAGRAGRRDRQRTTAALGELKADGLAGGRRGRGGWLAAPIGENQPATQAGHRRAGSQSPMRTWTPRRPRTGTSREERHPSRPAGAEGRARHRRARPRRAGPHTRRAHPRRRAHGGHAGAAVCLRAPVARGQPLLALRKGPTVIAQVASVGLVVRCDRCGTQAPARRYDRPPLVRPPRGWVAERSGRHRCPSCREDRRRSDLPVIHRWPSPAAARWRSPPAAPRTPRAEDGELRRRCMRRRRSGCSPASATSRPASASQSWRRVRASAAPDRANTVRWCT